MESLWPGVFVEDATLARHVSDVRKALGPSAGLVETVPKAGYRFVGAVVDSSPDASDGPARSGLENGEPRSGAEPVEKARRLRGVHVLGLLVVLSVLGVLGWRADRAPFPSGSPPSSIAVLPFTLIGDRADAEYLEGGLADVLIHRLSRIEGLEVRPLGAVTGRPALAEDLRGAGRALHVEAVLGGSIRRHGGRLRVIARLVGVADGRTLWTGSFDHADGDLIELENAIGREAVLALFPVLSPLPRTDSGPGTNDAEAHELYLRGRFFWGRRTTADHRKAVELFDAALDLDPDYANAEVGLAAATALLAGIAEPPELYLEARRHAERALRLAPRTADAHAVLGLVAQNYDGDWARAEREYENALRIQPLHPTTHHWYGEMLALLGRFDEGIALLERASRLDPLSLAIRSDLAKAHYFAGHWEEAVEVGGDVLALDDRHAWAWAWVAGAELALGQFERAAASAEKFDLLERSHFSRATLAWARVCAGDRDGAEAVRDELEHAARDDYVMPVALAMARLAVGDREQALAAFEQLVSTRQNRVGISTSPLFASLQDDPRFVEILHRGGLQPAFAVRAAPCAGRLDDSSQSQADESPSSKPSENSSVSAR